MLSRTQVQDALDAGSGFSPRTELGAPYLHAAGPSPASASRRPVCSGRASRRHQRTLVLLDDECRQRTGHAGRRRSELCPSRSGEHSSEGTRSNRRRCAPWRRRDVARRWWNVLCKFFDNMGPIPHHMHQSDAHAKLVGRKGKPEAYYFPPQYNQIDNNFPYTFMGLEPGTTRDDVRRCLENWNEGDNGILYLSSAYRLQVGTGWQIDPGILHAPGLACHLRAAGQQRRVRHVPVPGRRAHVPVTCSRRTCRRTSTTTSTSSSACSTGTPTSIRHFGRDNRVFPRPVRPIDETEPDGYREHWVCYGTGWYSAKELTVLPKRR